MLSSDQKKFYKYFKSSKNYFWQWEDETEIISIPNGSTIIYKTYAIDLLRKIAAVQQIPRFGVFLLVYIAIGENGKENIAQVIQILKSDARMGYLVNQEIIDFLELLPTLPPQYKTGLNRQLVFQTLFEGAHNLLSFRNAKAIFKITQSKVYGTTELGQANSTNSYAFHHDIHVILSIARNFRDVQSIIEGTLALPKIEQETLELEEVQNKPIPSPRKSSTFIDELKEQKDTFHIGALVPHIWSGLQIPFYNRLPSQHPLGGFADLSNKGTLDRLLLSEFANDDLVFLSRLANNEALYVNREIPPESNDLERIILIDVSLKNWGSPKAIAFALLLAISEHPKTKIPCKAFAVGSQYHPLNYATVEELVESLKVLEGCLDPSEGIECFFKDFPNHQEQEVFLITSEDSFQLVAMQKVIQDFLNHFDYMLNTSRTGKIRLYKQNGKNRKHIQDLQLPLNQLWKKPPNSKSKQNPNVGITNIDINVPILFPYPQNSPPALTTRDGVFFKLSREKNLFQFDNRPTVQVKNRYSYVRKGWQLLYTALPFYEGVFEIGRLGNEHLVLLLYQAVTRSIIMINISNNSQRTETFVYEWKYAIKHITFYKEVFYLTSQNQSLPNFFYVKYDQSSDKLLVKKVNDYLPEGVKAAQTEKRNLLKEFSRKYHHSPSILKNIKIIFINKDYNLVFNQKHELVLTPHGIFKLRKVHSTKPLKRAKATDDGFVFDDGSRIQIHRSGLFILESSHPDIPKMYISSALQMSLGIATEEHFAGNEYFNPIQEERKETMLNPKFWKKYMIPFVEHILA